MEASRNCNYFTPPMVHEIGDTGRIVEIPATCELQNGHRCTAFEDNKWCPEIEDDVTNQMLKYMDAQPVLEVVG